MNSRRFIRSSRSLRTTGRRVSGLDGRRTVSANATAQMVRDTSSLRVRPGLPCLGAARPLPPSADIDLGGQSVGQADNSA
jgi:hypothetical protein